MTKTWEQQVDFIRAMPAAASKILWALFLSGRSLTGKELQYACDMSEKTIDKGLAWLEPRHLIQNNGKFNGWSLTAVACQLPLPSAQLSAGHQNALPASHGADAAQNGHGESSGNGNGGNLGGENRKIYGFPSSSSSYSYVFKEEKEEKEEAGQNRKIYGFPGGSDLSPEQTAVRRMLIGAGVGANSQKMRELVALDCEPDFVADHIHAWKVRREPVSWLITRLLAGEAPPVCKCHDCRLKSPIPEQYRGIIEH